MAHLTRALPGDATLVDDSDAHGMLALQGPAALALLAPLCEGIDPLSAAPFTFAEARVAGVRVHGRAHGLHGRAGRRADLPGERAGGAVGRAARGRRGALRPRRARRAAARGLLPAARQRHHAGHERDRGRARLGLRDATRQFVGSDVLAPHARGRARSASSSRCAWTRSAPCRARAARSSTATTPIGEVTSGTFSPTLERGIGLGYVPVRARRRPDTAIAVDVRGRTRTAHTARKPLYVKET